jgi:hypothetical protein
VTAPFITPHLKLKMGFLSSVSHVTMKFLFTLAFSALKVTELPKKKVNPSSFFRAIQIQYGYG